MWRAGRGKPWPQLPRAAHHPHVQVPRGRPLLQLLEAPLVGADAFDEGDGERVKLVGLVSLVDDGQGNPEPEVLEVSDFFG